MRGTYFIVAASAFGAALMAGRFGPSLLGGEGVAHAHDNMFIEPAKGNAPAEGEALCAGGPETKLKTQLVLRSITTTKAGSAPDIELDLENGFEKEVVAVSAIELTDDRGKPVGRPAILPTRRVKKAAHESFRYTIPADLPAGHYHARVTTVTEMPDQSDRETVTDNFFFRVGSQGVVPVSHDEWHTHSNANLVSPKP